jgi:hypothetical protein
VVNSDTAFVPARRIDDLPSRNGAVRVDPVPPTVDWIGGRVPDLLVVPMSLCLYKFCHRLGATCAGDFGRVKDNGLLHSQSARDRAIHPRVVLVGGNRCFQHFGGKVPVVRVFGRGCARGCCLGAQNGHTKNQEETEQPRYNPPP